MGSCEPHDMGAGNQTQVLWKGSMCPQLLSHLSSHSPVLPVQRISKFLFAALIYLSYPETDSYLDMDNMWTVPTH